MIPFCIPSKSWNELIQTLLQEELQPPIYFSVVSCNGHLQFGKFLHLARNYDYEIEFLYRFDPEDSILRMPLNIMFIDRNGVGAQMQITEDDLFETRLN